MVTCLHTETVYQVFHRQHEKNILGSKIMSDENYKCESTKLKCRGHMSHFAQSKKEMCVGAMLRCETKVFLRTSLMTISLYACVLFEVRNLFLGCFLGGREIF